MSQDYANSLKVAASRHDIIGIHVYDKREMSIPNVGLLPVVDAETGKMQWVDTSSEKVRKKYKTQFKGNLQYFKDTFNRLGADTMSIATHESYIKALNKFFKERKSGL
jgi:hypothetical protein